MFILTFSLVAVLFFPVRYVTISSAYADNLTSSSLSSRILYLQTAVTG